MLNFPLPRLYYIVNSTINQSYWLSVTYNTLYSDMWYNIFDLLTKRINNQHFTNFTTRSTNRGIFRNFQTFYKNLYRVPDPGLRKICKKNFVGSHPVRPPAAQIPPHPLIMCWCSITYVSKTDATPPKVRPLIYKDARVHKMKHFYKKVSKPNTPAPVRTGYPPPVLDTPPALQDETKRRKCFSFRRGASFFK